MKILNSNAYKQALQNLNAEVGSRDAYLAKVFRAYPNLFFTKFELAGQNPESKKDLSESQQVIEYRNEFGTR